MATPPIVINYKSTPRGQVGERPRKLKPGTRIAFTAEDGQGIVVDFEGKSPLDNGQRSVNPRETVTIGKEEGVYTFKCFLIADGERVPIENGGEIEIRNQPEDGGGN